MAGYLYKLILGAGDPVVGINDSGQISGSGFAATHLSFPFIYSGTTTTRISLPSGFGTGGGINNSGDIVGTEYSLFAVQGFLYENGTVTALPSPTASVTLPPALQASFNAALSQLPDVGSGISSFISGGAFYTSANFPAAINDDGTVVGYYLSGEDGVPHGYVYDKGTYTPLNAPFATGGTVPKAINDAGQIVGYYTDATGKHGFLDDNGTFTTLNDSLGAPGTTVANGINDLGQIVGTYGGTILDEHGFIYDNGTYTTVDAFGSNFASTTLNGINEQGQLLGTITGYLGLMELSDGTFTEIRPPPGSTQVITLADINNNGDVVGYSSAGAFLLSAGIYTIVNDPASNVGYTVLAGINDFGDVVGTYLFNPNPEFQGDYHGFLLNSNGYTTIDDPNGVGHGGTNLTDISNNGKIVGSFIGSDDGFHGFLDDSGTYTTIDDPDAAGTTEALSVNDSGKVIGYYTDGSGIDHGFVYDGSTYTTLDDPLGTDGTFLSGINDSGEIVGTYIDSSGGHFFTYIGGKFTTIDTPFPTQAEPGPTIRVNDNGQLLFTAGPSEALQPFIADPPPAAPTDLSLDPTTDSGVQGDGITNVAQPKIDGQGTAGDTVTLMDGATTVGTGSVANDGSWQIMTSALGAGPHSLTATETDADGNTSDPSTPLSLTIDTTPPAAPTALTLDPSTDSGVQGDGITNDSTPKIDGHGTAGEQVTLYEGDAALGATDVGGDGAWSITAVTLLAGEHTLTAIEIDAAGNMSLPSAGLTLTIDNSVGAPTNLTLDPSTDSGTTGDNITSATQPKIDGHGEAGATVTLEDGTTTVGTGTVAGDGTWQITTSALGSGPHSLTATATDPAGNTSTASTALALTIDTTPPPAPTNLTLDPSTDNGAVGDNATSFIQPEIDGQGEAGDSVTLHDGSTTVGTGIVAGGGSWIITSSTLALGLHSLTAIATDAAGNTSSVSSALNLRIVSPPVGPPASNQFFYSGTDNQFVVGTSGTDTSWTNANGDLVDGLGGDDFLGGAGNSNNYDAGDGNDTVVALGDNDTVSGGSGNDLIIGSGNNGNIGGGDGNDTIWGSGGNSTVSGGAGDDVIGDSGNGDLIDPGTGSNTIYVSGTNDRVTGGGGDNTIYLGGGHDVLSDGAAVFNDTVVGFDQATGDRIHLTSDAVSNVLAHTSVVNGTDTLIALSNGSTILLKWTSHVDASFFS